MVISKKKLRDNRQLVIISNIRKKHVYPYWEEFTELMNLLPDEDAPDDTLKIDGSLVVDNESVRVDGNMTVKGSFIVRCETFTVSGDLKVGMNSVLYVECEHFEIAGSVHEEVE